MRSVILISVLCLYILSGCATNPEKLYPPSQTFTYTSVDRIQSAIINGYLKFNNGWFVRLQTPHTLVMSRASEGVNPGLVNISVDTGNSSPYLDRSFSFANSYNGIIVYVNSQVVLSNNFGAQQMVHVDDQNSGYRDLQIIKNNLEPPKAG